MGVELHLLAVVSREGVEIWCVCGALVSVLFQYVGVLGEEFCQYVVSMLEYSRRSFGGYWNSVVGGWLWAGIWNVQRWWMEWSKGCVLGDRKGKMLNLASVKV